MNKAASTKMQMPKVSIGMPVYNGEKYLLRALDSLLGQTYSNFELIISDNASTDQTGFICLEYARKDMRIRYIRQPRNYGPLCNFQFVLNMAAGENFMWAAADDEWDKEWIEELLKNINDDTMMSFGHVVSINENNEIIKTYKYRPYSRMRVVRLMQIFTRESSIYGKPNLIYSIFKSDFIKRYKIQAYNNSFWAADVHFIFDLAQSTPLSTNVNVRLHKRTVIDRSKVIQNKISFKSRAFFLYDFFIYQVTFLLIARGFLTKVILAMILPLNFIKSLTIRAIQSLCFKHTKAIKFILR